MPKLANLSNLKYVVARLRQSQFQKNFSDTPWLTESAVLLLETWLTPHDVGIEWGSGRSTCWLASRVAKLVSVENHAGWYADVDKALIDSGLREKVDYRHVDVKEAKENSPKQHPYAAIATEFDDNSLNFALVDGKQRLECVEVVMPKIKPGGLLILDNAERYIPNLVLGHHTTHVNQRKECPNERWQQIVKNLEEWRSIITTNHIWDTRFWVKP